MPARHHSGLSQAQIAAIAQQAASPQVQRADTWFRENEDQLCDWQIELAKIPSPPFGEAARANWLLQRFRDFGLHKVQIDEVGNVLGLSREVKDGEDKDDEDQRCVSLSAHIDTVFPEGTPLHINRHGSRLHGPGVSDNGAGITALLGIAAALQSAKIATRSPILFIGNVGEEGEGNLRGIRHIFFDSAYKDSIAYSLILDGAGCDTIVAEGLGSRRFEISVRGPGGHSWTDFGSPNPIELLAHAIHLLSQIDLPSSPKTTFNIGVIQGGNSVNSIPESASMRVDIRSTSSPEVDRLEKLLRDNLAFALDEHRRRTESRSRGHQQLQHLSCDVICIGDRPAGELPPSAHILHVVRAVDFALGNIAAVQRASTDANIPIFLGREAIAIGGGGTGGGAHTQQEWFDCQGRHLGLKRALLILLALAGVEN